MCGFILLSSILFVCLNSLVGWMADWLVGGWVGGWVGWLVGWLASWQVGWFDYVYSLCRAVMIWLPVSWKLTWGSSQEWRLELHSPRYSTDGAFPSLPVLFASLTSRFSACLPVLWGMLIDGGQRFLLIRPQVICLLIFLFQLKWSFAVKGILATVQLMTTSSKTTCFLTGQMEGNRTRFWLYWTVNNSKHQLAGLDLREALSLLDLFFFVLS